MNTAAAVKVPKFDMSFIQKRLNVEVNKDIVEFTLRTQLQARKNNLEMWRRLARQDVHRVGDVGFVKLHCFSPKTENAFNYLYGVFSPVQVRSKFVSASTILADVGSDVAVIENLSCVPAANSAAWFRNIFSAGKSDIEFRVRVIEVDTFHRVAYVAPLAFNEEAARNEWQAEQENRNKEKEFLNFALTSKDPTHQPYKALAVYRRYVELQNEKPAANGFLKLVRFDARSETAIVLDGRFHRHDQRSLKLHHIEGVKKLFTLLKTVDQGEITMDDLILNYITEVK